MSHRASSHAQRQERWLRLAPPQTRHLVGLISGRASLLLAEKGFRPVELTLGNPEWPISGRDLEFERAGTGFVDSVTISFDKYMSPRFQVLASRRVPEPPHSCIRAGNLVSRPTKYYCFWGKPWWLPSWLWSARLSAASASRVESLLGQLFRMLEDGSRGPNISTDVVRDAI
jgi:hypothetical protein